MLSFTGERIVPGASNCEPRFAEKMYHEHIARYAFAAQWIQGKRVLDVGCGVGYGSQWLADHGAASVLGFDISEEAVAHARQAYGRPNVEFRVASAMDFDFGQKFDVITCFELIEHVPDQPAVLRCIKNALSGDGVLVVSTPRPLDRMRSDFHVHELSKDEFQSLLRQYFDDVNFYFENNHFTSFVTNEAPTDIERVYPLYDQYSLDTADYFVAVASSRERVEAYDENISSTKAARPTLIVGDDRYVRLLEDDVKILKDAQNQYLREFRQLCDQIDGTPSDGSHDRARETATAGEVSSRISKLFDRLTSERERHEAQLSAERRQFEADRAALREELESSVKRLESRVKPLESDLQRASGFLARLGAQPDATGEFVVTPGRLLYAAMRTTEGRIRREIRRVFK